MTARPRILLAVFGVAMVIGVAPGSAAQAQAIAPDVEYRQCMDLTATAPDKALSRAEHWAGLGGGGAAQHCRAAALLAMGKTEQAALLLEELAQETRTTAAVKVGLLRQAARAWLTVGEAQRAEGVLTAALGVAPGNADVLEDRAVVRMELGQSDTALADLTAALARDPERLSTLVLRAAAYRRAGDTLRAAEDLSRASLIKADYPDVLLEQGNLFQVRGDVADARAVWMRVLSIAPDSPAADAARNRLAEMDAGG